MTRREEIEKAAKKNEFYKGDEVSTFVVAAQWADKTMIDKACEWLKKWTYQDCLWCFSNNKVKGRIFLSRRIN